MPDYKPIPTLEEIEDMDKQRSKAIESLDISNDNSNVKCQRCNSLWPIIKQNDPKRLLPSGNSGRIAYLEKRIRWVETHPHYVINSNNCKAEKEELAELLKEDKKRDILRRIPLYSSKMIVCVFKML
jgi:hypothetical protein